MFVSFKFKKFNEYCVIGKGQTHEVWVRIFLRYSISQAAFYFSLNSIYLPFYEVSMFLKMTTK
jgi:hypothetical protein